MNPFHVSVPFLPPLETLESIWFCDVFRGVIELENWREVNNRNCRKSCETCSKLTMKTPERLLSIPPENIRKPEIFWRFQGDIERSRSSVFIVNFEDISHLFLVFLLLTFSKQILAGIGLHSVILTFDPFHAAELFLYPLKIWGNLWFSDVFKGIERTCRIKSVIVLKFVNFLEFPCH